jgi:hypothetical protein
MAKQKPLQLNPTFFQAALVRGCTQLRRESWDKLVESMPKEDNKPDDLPF